MKKPNTQNTFSKGINMDANAMTVPKDVMTNCLNGTLITYDGNDGVLQNDMGNAKVHDAFLPSGWVPVGMKEYGGIIYVAAYNPEENLSLIGSFPSPQQNFENKNQGQLLLFTSLKEGKYKLFSGEDKDMDIKPGNKLAISLGYLIEDKPCIVSYDNIEPNFNNYPDHHKKRWQVSLCLLTSKGLLVDVTEHFKTLANNVVSNVYPNYTNYFFIDDYVADTETLEYYLRVYDGSLKGQPYILIEQNLALKMDTFVTSLYIDNKVTFIANCNIYSSSELYGYPFDSETGELGLIGFYYKYTTKNGKQGEGYKLISSNENIIGEYSSLEEIDNKKLQLLNCGIAEERLSITNSSKYILYLKGNYSLSELNQQEYILNIVDSIEIPDVDKDDVITLTISPLFKWDGEYVILESIHYTLEFEVSRIGSGIHRVNLWRYYVTDEFVSLTWGMESYPAVGEEISRLDIDFIDIDNNIVKHFDFNYFSYNGEFNELIESIVFENKYHYIVRFSWIVNGITYKEHRWLLPTKLYNDFYQNKMVQDFYLEWGVTPNGLEMANCNNLGSDICKLESYPTENIIEKDIDPFKIISLNKELDSSIKCEITYDYTMPSPKISMSELGENYPFILKFDRTNSINISSYYDGSQDYVNSFAENRTYDSTVSLEGNNRIIHTFTTYCPINYIYRDNIRIDQVYSAYGNEYKFDNLDAYVHVFVERSEASDDILWTAAAVHNIEALFGVFGTGITMAVIEWLWGLKDISVVRSIAKFYEDGEASLIQSILLYKLGNDDRTFTLGLHWGHIENQLNEVCRRTGKFIIPIIYSARNAGDSWLDCQDSKVEHCYWGMNYVVKNSDGLWILYFEHPYVKVWNLSENRHSYWVNTLKFNHIFNSEELEKIRYTTLYESGQYLRKRNVLPEYTSGYLVSVSQNSEISDDKDFDFNFTVDVEASLYLDSTIKNVPYNDILEKLCLKVNIEEKDNFKEQLSFRYDGSIIGKDGITLTISKTFEYLNILKGNLGIFETIENYRIYGIQKAVEYNGQNYTLNLDLDPDTVYKVYYLDGIPVIFDPNDSLTVMEFNGVRHIVPVKESDAPEYWIGDYASSKHDISELCIGSCTDDDCDNTPIPYAILNL